MSKREILVQTLPAGNEIGVVSTAEAMVSFVIFCVDIVCRRWNDVSCLSSVEVFDENDDK